MVPDPPKGNRALRAAKLKIVDQQAGLGGVNQVKRCLHAVHHNVLVDPFPFNLFMPHLGARTLTERRCSRPVQDAIVDSTLLPTRTHPDRRNSRNSLPRKPRERP